MFKYVLIKLADHAKDDGSDVRPSFGSVARECEVSYKTVQRAVEFGIAQGWLKEIPTPGNRINEYKFLLSALKKAPRHEDVEDEPLIDSAVGLTVQPVTQSSRSESPAGPTVQPVTESTSVGPTVHLSRTDSPAINKNHQGTIREPDISFPEPDLAAVIEQKVRAAEDWGGKQCYRNLTIRPRDMADLVAVAEYAPSPEELLAVVDQWVAKAAEFDGCHYARPLLTIKEWALQRKGQWAKVKKQLAKVAEADQFSPSGRKGRRGSMAENLAAMMGEGNV